MSAHVLLNLLNELRKMGGLPSILSVFRNEVNKLNETGARMLDSFYQMTYRLLLLNPIYCVKMIILSLDLCTQRYYGRHNVSRKSVNHCVTSLQDATSF